MPVSLVVFSSADNLFLEGINNVGTVRQIIQRIISYDKMIYTPVQVDRIFSTISDFDMKLSSDRRQHVVDVKAYIGSV